MERREALRLLASAVSLPLIPGELYGLLREARAVADSASALHALDAKQNASVTRMAEIILPETDTPGAASARVNEFIDLILTEWYSDEERQRFLKGLANVDAVSQKFFGKNFCDCTQPDQIKMMTKWDEAMAAEATALKAAPTPRMEIADPNHNFFFLFKQLTLTGYFTSEAGAKRALHFQMIPGRYDGCITTTPAERSK